MAAEPQDRYDLDAQAETAPRALPLGHFITVLLIIMAFAAVLRIAGIGGESFWVDEEWTRGAVNVGSLAAVVETCRNDVHPPTYFVLLHLWRTAFGDSDVAIRLLSALFGVLAVGAGGLAGRSIWDARTGLLGAAAIAVSVNLVRYSQEARMYSLVSLLAILMLWAGVQVIRRPTAGWWVLLGVAAFLMTLTHNYGLGLVPLLFVGLAIPMRGDRRRIRDLFLTLAAVGGAYALIWAGTFFGQFDVESLNWLKNEKPSVRDTLAVIGGIFVSSDAPFLIGGAVGAVTLGFFAWSAVRLPASERWLFLALTVVPVLGMAALAQVRGMWLFRAFAFVWPVAAMMVAHGITQLPSRGLMALAAVGLFGMSIFGTAARLQTHQKQEWREAAHVVADRAEPDDLVLVSHERARPSFERYYTGPPLSVSSEPKEPDWSRVDALCAEARSRGSALWYVESNTNRVLQQHLKSRADLRLDIEREFVGGVRVFRFKPSG
jgi:mannosyltransferase